ncbi:hypothetical protein I0D68_05775 [Pseudomonas lalucatii]|nr:hypothetical protein I0D68_05775 [Pseudomonas lalucatii]
MDNWCSAAIAPIETFNEPLPGRGVACPTALKEKRHALDDLIRGLLAAACGASGSSRD